MIIAGVDPGLSGGMVVIDGNDIVDVMPFNDATLHDIAETFTEWKVQKAYLENVHTFPKQGISSSGKFMRHFGQLEGILVGLKIPYELVSPQKWQKALCCLSKGNKNITKAKAQQLYPDKKWTHSTADAALIATYGIVKTG